MKSMSSSSIFGLNIHHRQKIPHHHKTYLIIIKRTSSSQDMHHHPKIYLITIIWTIIELWIKYTLDGLGEGLSALPSHIKLGARGKNGMHALNLLCISAQRLQVLRLMLTCSGIMARAQGCPAIQNFPKHLQFVSESMECDRNHQYLRLGKFFESEVLHKIEGLFQVCLLYVQSLKYVQTASRQLVREKS